MSQAIYLIFGK